MLSFQEKGRYFGYPECCIKHFMDIKYKSTMIKNYIPNNNTGFLPCKICADKVLNEGLTLANLLVNRECETTFPIGNGKKIIENRKILREKINYKT
uniref:Uncharacterized protein n=1 Tax=viral metagenome TaxID=1070528 RepID=A0A6C0F2Y7_9ZZZZ